MASSRPVPPPESIAAEAPSADEVLIDPEHYAHTLHIYATVLADNGLGWAVQHEASTRVAA